MQTRNIDSAQRPWQRGTPSGMADGPLVSRAHLASGWPAWTVFLALLLPAVAWAAGQSSIAPATMYMLNRGPLTGKLLSNADHGCLSFVSALNSSPTRPWHYSGGGFKLVPGLGPGCVYMLTGNLPSNLNQEYEGFFQNWVFLARICPAGYGLSKKYDPVTGVLLYYECLGAPNPRMAQPLPNGCGATPHPIHIATGIKYLSERDIAGAVGAVRRYRYPGVWGASALVGTMGRLGIHWQDEYSRSIVLAESTGATNSSVAFAERADGRLVLFLKENGAWMPSADVADRLVENTGEGGVRTGWSYIVAGGEAVEEYDANGKLATIVLRDGGRRILEYSTAETPAAVAPFAGLLIGVADDAGNRLSYIYGASGFVDRLVDAAGGEYRFTYDENANLTSVVYPDATTRQYHYENTIYKNALTGITDERGVRFVTYSYDSSGRPIGESLAGGVGNYALTYNTNKTVVTDPLGSQRTYNYQNILGISRSTGVSQPGGSGCGAAAESIGYDSSGNATSRLDFNGKKTTYAYDTARNLEILRTEGLSGSGAVLPETRSISTVWHADWRFPVRIEEYAGASASGTPLRRTLFAYDGWGNETERTVLDVAAGASRTWTTAYVYSTAMPGRPLRKTEDGPRTDVGDVTVTDYYPHDSVCPGAELGSGRDKGCRGQVMRVTNALGQITEFSRYNAHGQAELVVAPDGVVTTFAYDARQRLIARSTAGETTRFDHDGIGRLTRLTLPDGAYIDYAYDGARRLIAVADSAGNRIVYTLDAAGNRIREDIHDAQGALVKTLGRSYDALGRLQTLTGVGHE